MKEAVLIEVLSAEAEAAVRLEEIAIPDDSFSEGVGEEESDTEAAASGAKLEDSAPLAVGVGEEDSEAITSGVALGEGSAVMASVVSLLLRLPKPLCVREDEGDSLPGEDREDSKLGEEEEEGVSEPEAASKKP